MPCWVAPVVAAELWGVSLEHVLCAIADGSIESRREYGFVVVDVAPTGAVPEPRKRAGPPPPTYVVISDGVHSAPESSVLPVAVPWGMNVPGPEPMSVPPPLVPDDVPEIPPIIDDELPPLDDEEDDKPIGNWRQVRSSVGRSRKPPGRQALAA
jgi:hypothetical protein